MKPADEIRHAIETNDPMLAYRVFLEDSMAITHRVAPVLKLSVENAREWVNDQLLDIACNHLLSIQVPEAWRSFLGKAVFNRALSIARQPILHVECYDTVPDVPAPDSARPDTDDDADDMVVNESLDMFYRLSYRDRAILKLACSIMPSHTEWHGIAVATGTNADDLKQHFTNCFLNSDQDDTERETEIAGVYLKVIKRQNRIRRLKRELDEICLRNPADQDAEQRLIDRIEQETAAGHRQYRRYLKLQKPVRKRIPAQAIAQATGLTESDIYQIISRARRKIRNASS
jgi:hypothetical protein